MLTTKLKTGFAAVLVSSIATLSTPAYAVNEAMLDLLKILRDKGSITNQEYQLLRNAAVADKEKTDGMKGEVMKNVKEELADAKKSSESASWANNVKLKGDVRLRYQKQDEDGGTDRGRGRVRYRLGVIAKPTSGWEVGGGLASGSDDLRSTNQSFDSTFSTKGINLDYAYAQYKFNDNFKGIAGKFKNKNYLWRPTDLMWDSDINPEGFSLNYGSLNDFGALFANGGIWVLEENSSSDDDPFMGYIQLGQKFKSGDMFGTISGVYYGFGDTDALGDIVTDGTNTDGDFSIFGFSGELGTKIGGGKASIVAEYLHNEADSFNEDDAFSIGAKYSQGPWKFKYIYANLDTNAVPDILPDSDRFDGLTNIKGHEVALSYKLMKNVEIGLDYYHTEDKATDVEQDLFQADLVIKF